MFSSYNPYNFKNKTHYIYFQIKLHTILFLFPKTTYIHKKYQILKSLYPL